MMLAEKYAFEPKRLVKDPKIEVARKQCGHVVRSRLHARATQLRQEFKDPRLDHGKVIGFPHRFPSAARGNGHVERADDRFGSRAVSCNNPPNYERARFPQSCRLAIFAPWRMALNFSQMTVGCTSVVYIACEEKPQSAPAMTFSRPTSRAKRMMRSAISSGCSTMLLA